MSLLTARVRSGELSSGDVVLQIELLKLSPESKLWFGTSDFQRHSVQELLQTGFPPEILAVKE